MSRDIPVLRTKSTIIGKRSLELRCLFAIGKVVNSGVDINNTNRALRRGAGDSLNQTGRQMVRRNILPTLIMISCEDGRES
jgi:hypothetical protein